MQRTPLNGRTFEYFDPGANDWRVRPGAGVIHVALRRGGRPVRGGTVAIRGPGFSRTACTTRLRVTTSQQ